MTAQATPADIAWLKGLYPAAVVDEKIENGEIVVISEDVKENGND